MNTVRIDDDDGTPIYRGTMGVCVQIEVDVDVTADSFGELHASITEAEWAHAKSAAIERAIELAQEGWEGE